jgi:predicted acetyltransferase
VTLSFRPAREEDLERLVDIHTSAFPDPRGHAARIRNFTRHPLGELSDLWLLADGDAPLAHAFLFPLEVWVGGARVQAGGIATVGVAPEARGRGLGSRLVEHLHRTAHARGDALTVLYAYRQGFYARLGYAPTSSYRRLRLHPASVPWKCEMTARAAGAGDIAAISACWNATARRGTGWLARTDRLWETRLGDERRTWLVVQGAEGVEGYVAWTLEQAEEHAATTLVVREMAAMTPAAERSLWALVGAQRHQVAVAHADVAADDPIDRALVDPDRARFGDDALEHPVGEVATGPMVRVLDAGRALAARGWPRDGRVVLAVDDETLEVVARGGTATVLPVHDEPDLRLDARALAAIAFGTLPASHAARLGWAVARDPAALALADAFLALPPYFSPDPF